MDRFIHFATQPDFVIVTIAIVLLIGFWLLTDVRAILRIRREKIDERPGFEPIDRSRDD